eukprot:scaffold15698_cov154-Skeletonema_marinoi.AAC.3
MKVLPTTRRVRALTFQQSLSTHQVSFFAMMDACFAFVDAGGSVQREECVRSTTKSSFPSTPKDTTETADQLH